MLSVVSPGKFVLTLQSISPFFVESILVLILAVLLAVPLIVHVQYLLGKPLQVNMKTISPFDHWYEPERSSHVSRVVMHYPSPKFPESTSSLSLNLGVESARKTFSTPILQKSGDTLDSPNRRARKAQEPQEDSLETKPSKTLPLEHSSSFVVTNSEVPIIDISSFNYNAYRHKLIEAILRKRYDDYQPPGNVILNSIHLNTTNSMVEVKLNDRYDHSFCDFIEGHHDATQRLSRKEMEYLHPLDHFLVKGSQKPQTTDRATETMVVEDEDKDVDDYDELRDQLLLPPITAQNFRKHSNIDRSANTSNITVKLPSRASSVESSKLVCTTGSNISRSINPQEKKHQSLKNSGLISPSEKKRSAKSSPMRSSVDSLNSRTLTASKKPLKGSVTATSSRYEERESTAFCTSFSSSENESVFSDSSKLLEESSARSCDELSTSKSRSSTPKKLQSSPVGTPFSSSNKKYGSISKQNSDTSGRRSLIPSDSTPLNVNELSCRPRSANLPLLSRGPKGTKIGSSDKTTVGNSKNFQGCTEKSTKKVTSKFQAFEDRTSLNTRNETVSKIASPSSEFSTPRTIRADCLSPRPKTVSGIVSKVPVAISSLQSRNRSKLLANNVQRPAACEDRESKSLEVTNAKNLGSSALKNVDRPLSSRGHDEQCLRRKVDRKSEDTITLSRSSIRPRSSKCSSKMVNSVEKCKNLEKRKVKDKEAEEMITKEKRGLEMDLKLPQRGTKVSLAMQSGLKNYMQKLKEVTLNRSEKDITRLVSLSLTEAILPDLQSVLSASELQELTDLLNRAEIKSQREATKLQASGPNMT